MSLSQRIDDAIHASPYLQRRQLSFQADDGRVVLRGEVPSYFQKQIAQETIKHVDGVTSIENELVVNWNDASPESPWMIDA